MSARSSLDLDLLMAFDALFEQRSVSAAARQLGLTQSALSKRLARLRVSFLDELFVRSGEGVAPTARALDLADPVRAALHGLQDLITPERLARPESSRRTFRIAGNDLGAAVLLPNLMARLTGTAPGVKIAWRTLDRTAMADALERGEVDFAVTILPDPPSSLRRAEVLRDRFVCLASERHPTVERKLTLDAFVAARHLIVTTVGDFHGVVDRLLEERGLARKVVLSLPFHLAVPALVARSDLVATLPLSVAALAPWPGVRQHALPLPHTGFADALYWHRRHDRAPAHAWLRGEILAASHST
jgi:LysR family transcriptional regulator, mexEF-oprN operon transcriptional activator